MWRFLKKPGVVSAAMIGASLLGAGATPARAGLIPMNQQGSALTPRQVFDRTFDPRCVSPAEVLNFAQQTVLSLPRFALSASAASSSPAQAESSFGCGQEANRVYPAVPGAGTEDVAADYIVSWEDRLGHRAERSLDDMVIEIRLPEGADQTASVVSEPLLIPLPSALWSGLSSFVCLGVLGVVKRSRGRRW